jgi:uncharacterized phiE125 gp8 family phage protein
MSLVLTSGPALEPISLAEAKAHLRITHTLEDALIQSLIITSRLHIEAALGLALITQGWSVFLDRWPRGHRIALPIRPVLAIGQVRIWAPDGTSSIVAPDKYLLDGHGIPARLVWQSAEPPSDAIRAANGIEIALTAGFGAAPADVPATIRHALLLLVAHWYENREPVEIGAAGNAIPAMVSELLAPYRRRRV